MLGLTTLGTLHTLIGLVAVVAGAYALIRDKEITLGNGVGKFFVLTTVLTCVAGFGIFEHGGFGNPHVLGILTLVVLAVAAGADKYRWFGATSRYVATIGYSLSFFFHFIPGVTETFTRLPRGAPLFTGPDDPSLVKTIGVLFVVFIIGATLQVKRMRRTG